MFEQRPRPIALRGFVAALCVALLAGCAGSKMSSPDNALAAVPEDLAATGGDAMVTLSWTASSGATGYHVKRAATSGGPYTDLASPTSPAYMDSSVTNGTAYYYVVSALDSAGESADSAQATATPEAPLAVPAAPANLRASAGNAQVSLTWSASSGASSYNVKRSTVSGGPYTQLAAATSPSYTDDTVSNGTTYDYVVTAANSAGESADSTQVSVTPDPTITTPAIPMGLAATPGNAQVSLTWSASSGATGYHVKRATTSGGPYTQVGAPTSPSYTDPSLTNGTIYYYVVSALDSAGESANSAQVSATPAAPVAVPAVPTGLAATPGNAQVSLTWSASSGATGYHVKRATTSGGPYTQVGAPTSPSYTDPSLTNGTIYYYVVSALDSAGESANSAQVSATPAAPVAVPAVPTGLAATPGNAQVSLTWSASSGATSYHVKRATTSGGPYTQVGAPTSPSYTDPSLTNGTAYYYVVSALDSAGESANSAQVSATPAAPGPPPTSGTWINVTPSNVDLTDNLDCGNYGTESVGVDTTNATLYTEFNCQGIWKSTDFGLTWTGPINTGTNGATAGDCAGGITVSPTATVPTLYESCLRGNGLGFWKSVDGGVSWTQYFVAPTGASRQDVYSPAVDPYDPNHLLMTAHEQNFLLESVDGGQTWTNVTTAAGMQEPTTTADIFFIDTGSASTTHGTWLWMAQGSGGIYGTWRTANSGATWVQVDKNEHPAGVSQIYQPDNNGVVYMAGLYSALGWGVLRSPDYGQTWSHVGSTSPQTAVVGTSNNIYAMYGWSTGPGVSMDPNFELGAQPGTGNWASPTTPAGMNLGGGAAHISVVNDGTHNILVAAMRNGGLWRYVEP